MSRTDVSEIEVYTAVFGRPDVLLEPAFATWRVRMRCFTDMRYKGKSMWEFVERRLDHYERTKRNRYVKILWPVKFRGYRYSLYMDSCVELLVDPEELIRYLEPGSDLCVFVHPERDCLYEEAAAVVRLGLDKVSVVGHQVEKYSGEGHPPHWGLWAGTFLLRRNSEKMREFCRCWWKEVRVGSRRDQISLPYVIRKLGVKVSVFPGSLLKNELMSWRPWERRDRKWREVWEVRR